MKSYQSYYDGMNALSFECEDNEHLHELGLLSNGYFWEGMVEHLHSELMEDLDFDSEAGMFLVTGPLEALETVQESLDPLLADPKKTAKLAKVAQEKGFTFDC